MRYTGGHPVGDTTVCECAEGYHWQGVENKAFPEQCIRICDGVQNARDDHKNED